LKVVFLGTGGSMPTQSRGSSATAVKRMGEVILFDCGEGTQSRIVAARLGFRRPMHVLISHLHGDHVLGLPGLLQSMTLLRRERRLDIYGPKGLVEFIEAFTSTLGAPTFPTYVHEIAGAGTVYSGPEYRLLAVEADHDGECWSYALEEHPRPGRFHPEAARRLGVPEGPLWKRLQNGEDVALEEGRVVRPYEVVDPPRRGRKLVYSGDTRPNGALVEMAEGADVLIHEATFDDSLMERADEDGHSTAGQAAEIALKAGAEVLVLTHISSRYPDTGVLLEQARAVFPETIVAEDMMDLEVPLEGFRGAP